MTAGDLNEVFRDRAALVTCKLAQVERWNEIRRWHAEDDERLLRSYDPVR
jgi:hypothetical protein